MPFNRRAVLTGLTSMLFCPLCRSEGAKAADGHAPHWSYTGAGDAAHWADLSPEWKTCSVGNQESPVNLTTPIKAAIPPLKIDWQTFPLAVVNNGHTIQVNAPAGSTIAAGDGEKFTLKQFHFHHPSEHSIDGKLFGLEVHFVHSNPTGTELTVLGVMFAPGAANPVLTDIWAHMPADDGKKDVPEVKIDPKMLLPDNLARYHYEGSLTTPPCTENVNWHVLRDPITASEEQVATFAKLFPNNARPVQAINRRFLLSDF